MKRSSPHVLILLISSAAFLIYGIFNAGVGPVLGELSEQTGVSLAAVGALITAVYSGSLLAQIVSGSLTDRFGRKLPFIISTLMFATGIFGIVQSSSITMMLAFGFLAGLGQGGVDLGANLIVADAYHKNNVAALNIVHLAFGLGSAAGPALVSLSLASFDRGTPVLAGTVILFVLLAIVSVFTRMELYREAHGENAVSSQVSPAAGNIYRLPTVWLLGMLLLLTVGSSAGIGSWFTIYLTRTTPFDTQTAALFTSGFWAMITVGRVAAAAASRWLSPMRILLLNLSGALLSGGMLVLAHGFAVPTAASVLLIGFCCAGLYPGIISLATNWFPSSSGKAASLVVAMGTIGGLALPALAGVILENLGTLAYVLLIEGIFGVMLFLYFLTPRNRSESVLKLPAASIEGQRETP